MERIRFHHRSAIHSSPAQAVLNRPCHLLLKRLRSKQPQYLNAENQKRRSPESIRGEDFSQRQGPSLQDCSQGMSRCVKHFALWFLPISHHNQPSFHPAFCETLKSLDSSQVTRPCSFSLVHAGKIHRVVPHHQDLSTSICWSATTQRSHHRGTPTRSLPRSGDIHHQVPAARAHPTQHITAETVEA